ncbi:MAG: hypothetical protein F4103_08320 [Boseongicola sp. SB0673_bin_14]|nr:hypothetical protein [Gammaproteobacteria bacterium]MYI68730.1 hypothetical protein [Boseongicola sp. SB0673_bin_14]
MPADVAFDTLAEAERLAKDGVAEADAKAITAHSARILGGLASREDLAHEVALLNSELRAVKAELRWIKIIGAGIVAILVGALGFGFNMLLGMTGDIATLQADISTVQSAIAAQGADIVAIKEAIQALAGGG